MSLGVYGFGCEDSLNHLLNYVWPNVFETSPHVIQAVMGALEGLRVAIGPCRMLQYCLQVCYKFLKDYSMKSNFIELSHLLIFSRAHCAIRKSSCGGRGIRFCLCLLQFFFVIVRFFSLLKGNVWNHVFVIVSGVKIIYVFEN